MPKTPPRTGDILQSIAQKDISRLGKVMLHSRTVDEKGRYLHWDELRFKKAPADLSHEEWWAAVRLARSVASQPLPLKDISEANFSYSEPPALRAALRELDMNAGGSLASDVHSLSSGEGRLYLRRSLAEEPFASSLIEGAATTRQRAKQLIFEGRAPRTKDERMVLNNYLALEFVKSHKNDDLTLDILLELHRLITADTLDDPDCAGKIRTTDDVQVVDDSTNEILHQPPAAAALHERLSRLFEFANKKNEPNAWVHPIVKACLLHFMLGYEHPFVDGNGRVARALFYWSVLRDDYWLMEYISISSVIAESKMQYGKSFLFSETDEADVTYFLIYNTKIIQTAITRLSDYVARRREEVAAFEENISPKNPANLLNHRQTWLLNEFARGRLARTSIGEHRGRNGVSYLTARADLESLYGAGLLRKTRIGRESIYQPVRDLVQKLTSPRKIGAA